jgi:hypothetical protein
MRIITNGGVEPIQVDHTTASIIGAYWNDIRRFLATGDGSVLDLYRGVLVDGFELENPNPLLEVEGCVCWRHRPGSDPLCRQHMKKRHL